MLFHTQSGKKNFGLNVHCDSIVYSKVTLTPNSKRSARTSSVGNNIIFYMIASLAPCIFTVPAHTHGYGTVRALKSLSRLLPISAHRKRWRRVIEMVITNTYCVFQTNRSTYFKFFGLTWNLNSSVVCHLNSKMGSIEKRFGISTPKWAMLMSDANFTVNIRAHRTIDVTCHSSAFSPSNQKSAPMVHRQKKKNRRPVAPKM